LPSPWVRSYRLGACSYRLQCRSCRLGSRSCRLHVVAVDSKVVTIDLKLVAHHPGLVPLSSTVVGNTGTDVTRPSFLVVSGIRANAFAPDQATSTVFLVTNRSGMSHLGRFAVRTRPVESQSRRVGSRFRVLCAPSPAVRSYTLPVFPPTRVGSFRSPVGASRSHSGSPRARQARSRSRRVPSGKRVSG
jgi:hypothetical protein